MQMSSRWSARPKTERDGREVILYANHHGHWASWTFYSALGEMRGTFGVHPWRRSPPSSSWTSRPG